MSNNTYEDNLKKLKSMGYCVSPYDKDSFDDSTKEDLLSLIISIVDQIELDLESDHDTTGAGWKL